MKLIKIVVILIFDIEQILQNVFIINLFFDKLLIYLLIERVLMKTDRSLQLFKFCLYIDSS